MSKTVYRGDAKCGKGSVRRPEVRPGSYATNYEKIFKPKKKKGSK